MGLMDLDIFSFPGIYIILTARKPKIGTGSKKIPLRISTRKNSHWAEQIHLQQTHTHIWSSIWSLVLTGKQFKTQVHFSAAPCPHHHGVLAVVALQCAILGSKMKMANRKIKWDFWGSFFSLLIQVHCRRGCSIKKLLNFEHSHLCCLEKNCLTHSNEDISKGPKSCGFGRRQRLGWLKTGTFYGYRIEVI